MYFHFLFIFLLKNKNNQASLAAGMSCCLFCHAAWITTAAALLMETFYDSLYKIPKKKR